MRNIIGLIGKKRSGKDTFAQALPGYTRVAFADPLREALLAEDPFVPIRGTLQRLLPMEPGVQASTWVRVSKLVQAVGWEVAKDKVPEVRRLLQTYGRAIRAIDPDFWLRAGIAKIEAIEGDVIVTDVRFPNEAQAITELDGTLVRIVRPGVQDDDTDESEVALDDYPADVLVRNASTLEELQEKARTVADVLANW